LAVCEKLQYGIQNDEKIGHHFGKNTEMRKKFAKLLKKCRNDAMIIAKRSLSAFSADMRPQRSEKFQ
jgi:hypothetical protein